MLASNADRANPSNRNHQQDVDHSSNLEHEGWIITDEKLDTFFKILVLLISSAASVLFGYLVFKHEHFEQCDYIFNAEQKFEIVTSDTSEDEVIFSLCLLLFDSASWFLYGFILYLMLTARIALSNSPCQGFAVLLGKIVSVFYFPWILQGTLLKWTNLIVEHQDVEEAQKEEYLYEYLEVTVDSYLAKWLLLNFGVAAILKYY